MFLCIAETNAKLKILHFFINAYSDLNSSLVIFQAIAQKKSVSLQINFTRFYAPFCQERLASTKIRSSDFGAY